MRLYLYIFHFWGLVAYISCDYLSNVPIRELCPWVRDKRTEGIMTYMAKCVPKVPDINVINTAKIIIKDHCDFFGVFHNNSDISVDEKRFREVADKLTTRTIRYII